MTLLFCRVYLSQAFSALRIYFIHRWSSLFRHGMAVVLSVLCIDSSWSPGAADGPANAWSLSECTPPTTDALESQSFVWFCSVLTLSFDCILRFFSSSSTLILFVLLMLYSSPDSRSENSSFLP